VLLEKNVYIDKSFGYCRERKKDRAKKRKRRGAKKKKEKDRIMKAFIAGRLTS
jgi:hypothetical protein